eukprot:721788-Pyramimonas_sp.AAC.1
MGGNPDGRQPAGETRAERTPVVQAGAARPPPDSVARSPPGDPLGRGDTPRQHAHTPLHETPMGTAPRHHRRDAPHPWPTSTVKRAGVQ